MMLSLLLIPLVLFSACGTPPAPPSVEMEPPAQVQPVQPDEPAEAVPDPAETAGLIAGYPDGQFGVGDPVTRQQVATILWRWAGSPAASAGNYSDENAISAYAQMAVDWSRSNGIIAARSDGRFAPTDNATRGEIVSALYNYMGKTSTPPASTGNGKILVAYFSASGNTEAVANAIADTLKEFDLLLCLARRPGHVLSRTQLYSQVWSDNLGIGGENAVKVHIGNLRKKLADVGKNYIQTSWGIGYKFVPPEEEKSI